MFAYCDVLNWGHPLDTKGDVLKNHVGCIDMWFFGRVLSLTPTIGQPGAISRTLRHSKSGRRMGEHWRREVDRKVSCNGVITSWCALSCVICNTSLPWQCTNCLLDIEKNQMRSKECCLIKARCTRVVLRRHMSISKTVVHLCVALRKVRKCMSLWMPMRPSNGRDSKCL